MTPEKSMRSSKVRAFPGDVLGAAAYDGVYAGASCTKETVIEAKIYRLGNEPHPQGFSLRMRGAALSSVPFFHQYSRKSPGKAASLPGGFFHTMSSTMAGSRVPAVLPLLHRIYDGAAGEDDQNHAHCYIRPVPLPPVLGNSEPESTTSTGACSTMRGTSIAVPKSNRFLAARVAEG